MVRPTGSSDAMVGGDGQLGVARETSLSTIRLLGVDAGAVCYSDGIAT